MIKIGNDWDELLKPLFQSENYQHIRNFLKTQYATNTVYPPMHDIYNAFKLTPYHKVKAVILGQDPYHGEGQAHGLAFSVQDGIKVPPSLVNIYKELQTDLGIPISTSGNLTNWAKNGVLMLNASLTVQANNAGSHSKIGWQQFTDEIIKLVNEKSTPVVFFLWGNYAKTKAKYIDSTKHLILQSAHPSPLSAYHGFFGSKQFSQCNTFLTNNGITPINWRNE